MAYAIIDEMSPLADMPLADETREEAGWTMSAQLDQDQRKVLGDTLASAVGAANRPKV